MLFVARNVNCVDITSSGLTQFGQELLFVALAQDGVHAKQNGRVPAGCGGAFLAVGPKWSPYITDFGIITSKREFWVHLEHPQWGRVGVMSIYTPNKPYI